VDAERFTAAGADPLQLLLLDKAPQSVGFNALQILNHAHPVIQTVALVQSTQAFARETRAVAAEICASAASLSAVFDFARDASLRLAAIVAAAARAGIPGAQKAATEAAIHAARRNERGRIEVSSGGFPCIHTDRVQSNDHRLRQAENEKEQRVRPPLLFSTGFLPAEHLVNHNSGEPMNTSGINYDQDDHDRQHDRDGMKANQRKADQQGTDHREARDPMKRLFRQTARPMKRITQKR
jgi:hypothetical protein